MIEERKPKNIFEQILFGQQIVNENIVALSENLNAVHQQLSTLLQSLDTISTFEPNASGEEDTIS